MEIEARRTGGAGCGCGGCVSLLFSLGMAVVLPVVILVVVDMSHTESDAAALAAMAACPPVAQALGTPLERAPMSMSCGEYEGSGRHAESQWSLSIRGPKGSASAWYMAEQNGGPWVVEHATVELSDGRTITAVPCEQTAPAPRPPERPPRRGKAGKRR